MKDRLNLILAMAFLAIVAAIGGGSRADIVAQLPLRLISLGFLLAGEVLVLLVIVVVERIRSIPLIITLLLLPPAMYFLFDTLLEVQLPGGTLWY